MLPLQSKAFSQPIYKGKTIPLSVQIMKNHLAQDNEAKTNMCLDEWKGESEK